MEWPPRATEARRNEARLEIGAGRCGSLATVGREVWCTDDEGSSCSSIGTWRGAARLLDSLADMVQPACYLLFGLGFEPCTASPSEMLSRRSDNLNIAICGHIATQLFNKLCTIFFRERSLAGSPMVGYAASRGRGQCCRAPVVATRSAPPRTLNSRFSS